METLGWASNRSQKTTKNSKKFAWFENFLKNPHFYRAKYNYFVIFHRDAEIPKLFLGNTFYFSNELLQISTNSKKFKNSTFFMYKKSILMKFLTSWGAKLSKEKILLFFLYILAYISQLLTMFIKLFFLLLFTYL